MSTNTLHTLTSIAGHPVELTIRGERSFTFSFDAVDAAAGQRLAQFFGKLATCSVMTDDEIGTFVYVEVGH